MEEEIKKRRVRESVLLSDAEIAELDGRYDKDFLKEVCDQLNSYKLSKGAKYASDYHALVGTFIPNLKDKYLNWGKRVFKGNQKDIDFFK